MILQPNIKMFDEFLYTHLSHHIKSPNSIFHIVLKIINNVFLFKDNKNRKEQ